MFASIAPLNSRMVTQVCAAVLLLQGATAYSAVLAQYGFTENSMAADASDPLVSASSITSGVGLTLFESTTSNSRGFPAALFSGVGDGVLQLRSGGTVNEAAAITAQSYFQLTLEVEAGYQLDFTQLTFNAASTGDTQPRLFAVHADYGTGFVGIGSSNGLASSSVTFTSLSLSQFTNITSSIAFRFYMIDGASSGTRTLGIDDIIIHGTVAAVPEPGSAALVLVGAAGLLRRRLRR